MGPITAGNSIMVQKFNTLLTTGKFETALEIISSEKISTPFNDFIYKLGDNSNFSSYGFLLFFISKFPSRYNHSIAYFLTATSINYLEGAYQASAHHARSDYEIAVCDNEDIFTGAEGLLSLYSLPEAPIPKKEAVLLAQKILTLKPDSNAAKDALEAAERRQDEPLLEPHNDHEKLEQLIKAGFLSEAAQLAATMNEREVHQILLYIGCEEQNLCAYTLTWLLIQKKESAELHYIAYKIVTVAWAADMVGCQATGAFHLRQAMKLDTANIKYGEHFLQLHTQNPQDPNIIPDTEAEAIANKLFDLTYFSHPAERVLAKFGKIHPRFAK